jgi:hypothetical protein
MITKINILLLLVFTFLITVLVQDIRTERRAELGRLFVETAAVRYF